ncbi:caspase family protein [Bradyrhizobium japonicum]|nr:caspase family protein [Bradyrhizobium japonicum]
MILPFLLMMLCVGTERAAAEKRVALVIGNSKYERTAPLSNPANDATLIAETFKSVGFDDVELRRDLKVNDMRRALRDFIDKSRDADVAVVYYAGHGIEVDGVNYLVPVDAVLERDVDVYDEALTLDRVLVSVEPAKQLRLVILDACRDNPFARSMKRTMASRAIGRGLAKVEPSSPNTLIAFASKAGSTAADGDGKNSPFTAALVRYITNVIRPAIFAGRLTALRSAGKAADHIRAGDQSEDCQSAGD